MQGRKRLQLKIALGLSGLCRLCDSSQSLIGPDKGSMQ
jgi:hypothetical protein